MNAVTLTLQLASLDGDALDQAMIRSLTDSGYLVTRAPSLGAPKWETPGQFCRRVGIHPGSFSRRWKMPGLPVVQFETGPMGKNVKRLVATPELEVFMLSAKAHDIGSVSLDGLLKAARAYAKACSSSDATTAGSNLLSSAARYYGREKKP